jgi:Na+/melibiose symporter-like transporter
MLPLGVVLPTYYAESTLASMAAIGIVTGICRLFDAVTDPLIGYLSDRTKTGLGARKPWIVAGSAITCVSIFFLFRPSHDVGIVYYAVSSFGLFLGYAMFDIPHKAWGAEITVDYNDRSRVSGHVSVAQVAGSLLFWVVPILLFPFTGTKAINGDSLDTITWLFIVLLPLCVLGAVRWVPDGPVLAQREVHVKTLIASIRSNKPLWRFVAAVATWGIGQGIYLSVVFVFMRDYMQLGEQFAVLMIVFFVVQFVSMPIWVKLMYRFGKHRTWAFSWGFGVLWSMLVLLVTPGASAFWPVLGLMCVSAFVNAASYIAPRALLGDIVDYDLLKTRTNSAGNYFAFSTLLDKALFGIGVAIAFPLLSVFGYRIGADNAGVANLGLFVCYLVIPTITHLTAATILWNFPIDSRRHAIIRKRLEQRVQRAGRLAIAT